MIDNVQVEEKAGQTGMKSIFADGAVLGARFKGVTKQTPGKNPEKQQVNITGGLIEITFVDSGRQQPLGRFVFDRQTAQEILVSLNDAIAKFDETIKQNDLSKLMPKKQPEKTDKSYR
jgi:hypothetical protein